MTRTVPVTLWDDWAKQEARYDVLSPEQHFERRTGCTADLKALYETQAAITQYRIEEARARPGPDKDRWRVEIARMEAREQDLLARQAVRQAAE